MLLKCLRKKKEKRIEGFPMTPIGFLVSNIGLLDDLTEQLYASFGYESHANIQLISCLVKELFNRNKLSLFHHPEKLFSCKFS